MVMFVPPATGPLLGVMLLIVGGGGLKKKAVLAAFVPPAVVTSTLASPGECAGVVAAICVALFTVNWLAFVPPRSRRGTGEVRAGDGYIRAAADQTRVGAEIRNRWRQGR